MPVTKDISGKTGLLHGQKYVDNTEKHKNKYSSEVGSHGCDNRDKELANRGEFLVSDVVVGASGFNVKAQSHPEHGQFIFPGCGKGFRRKDNFLIHYRHHTGEKPSVAIDVKNNSLRNII
ncbi:hypothetical protein AVEN_14353-1 [Araneus ventricosus]|uniref:C2H2-type domain-containing protein n=1 Tax=Araneus ventricosus TaxID=182803 RepID=A0A4Y2NCF2_ARAVE|nr:hypothetical protein AVEN_14353-1 [Araneus ventricosus]